MNKIIIVVAQRYATTKWKREPTRATTDGNNEWQRCLKRTGDERRPYNKRKRTSKIMMLLHDSMQQRNAKLNPPAMLPMEMKTDSSVLTWHEPTSLLALWTWSLPHACTRTERMKITSYNPARVGTDFLYEPHGWSERLFMRAREATYFHYDKRLVSNKYTP